MILIPTGDPARFWQTSAIAGHEPAYELLANLFLYATEHRDLKVRGESWLIVPQPNLSPPKSIKIARLQHTGNWNPEPAGWPRTRGECAPQRKPARADDRDRPSSARTSLGPAGYSLAHLNHHGKFKLTDPQRAELKTFLDTWRHVPSGPPPVAIPKPPPVLKRELTTLAGAKPQPSRSNHPLYQNLGLPAAEIAYRPYAMKRSLGQIKGPRLRAAMIKDRPAILYSPEDLSVGLVGQPIDGIFGYTPQSAAAICRAVLLSAAK